MKIYTVERKFYPKKVRKMKVMYLPPSKTTDRFKRLNLEPTAEVYVRCDNFGNFIERGKDRTYRILSVDDHPIIEVEDITNKKFVEADLEVYDLWQAPSGNLFLKVNEEYSIPIGTIGNHGPDEHNPVLRFSPSNDVTPVKKVGRLQIDFNKILTREELDVIEYEG
jgi:hypothetical protein